MSIASTAAPLHRLQARLLTWEGLLGAFAILLILTAVLTTPGFADGYNLGSSVARMAAKALMVLPLVFLIIAREIDISVASIAGLTGITFGMVIQSGGSTPVAAVAALAVGLACGVLNGFLVAVLGLPSLVVTLGTLALFRGLCYVLVGGTPISNMPPEIISLGNDSILGTYIPAAIVPFLLLAPVFLVVLHKTPFGRRVFAIGGNPATASYSGVKNRKIIFELFVTSGLVAALAGIIHVGITSSASPDGALGYELDVVTVVFLGGISFLGGKGRMTGVFWALVVVIAIRSMLQLQNFGAYGQAAVVGLVLILSLLMANITNTVSSALAARRTRAQKLGPGSGQPVSPSVPSSK
ncbi:ABC transporter permease [Arthrobacter sp. NicSoilE8]|nr:ABC transporter permease [Arthrobacter sp. NicSoilE8]